MTILEGLLYIIFGALIIYSVACTLAWFGANAEIHRLKKELLRRTIADIKRKQSEAREGMN